MHAYKTSALHSIGLLFVVLLLLLNPAFTQTPITEIEGDTKVRGNIDLAHPEDETTLNIGYNAGIDTDFSIERNSTMIGSQAGRMNTIGYDLTFVGAFAGLNNSEGDQNSFLGVDAGRNNTTGYRNTFLGHSSGFQNIGGRDNCFVGSGAGYRGTGGIRNTFLGVSAGQLLDTGSLENAIAMGYRAKVNCDHCAVIGGTGTESVNLGVGISQPSADFHLHETSNTRLKISNDDSSPLDLDLVRDNDGGNLRDWRIRNNNQGIMEIGHSNDLDNGSATILLELSPIRFSPSTDGTIELGIESKQWEKVWTREAQFSEFMHLIPQNTAPTCSSIADRGKVYYDNIKDKLRICTSISNNIDWVDLH